MYIQNRPKKGKSELRRKENTDQGLKEKEGECAKVEELKSSDREEARQRLGRVLMTKGLTYGSICFVTLVISGSPGG